MYIVMWIQVLVYLATITISDSGGVSKCICYE